MAGNAIYGDNTSACLLKSRDDFCSHCPFPNISEIYQYNGVNDTSDLSSFTSDPTRVCFCENGIPDCYRVLSNRTVHPGERFYLSLALVGYGLGTVPGSVIARGRGNVSFGNTLENIQEVKEAQCQDVGYSIVSKNDRQQIALAVDTLSFTISLEKVNLVVDPLTILTFCGSFQQHQCRTILPNPSICGGGSPPVSSWFPTSEREMYLSPDTAKKTTFTLAPSPKAQLSS